MHISHPLTALAVAVALFWSPAALAQRASSVYTTLDADECQTIRVYDETGDTDQRCPGVAGYTLIARDGDARMTLDVVAPNGTQSPLGYTRVITSAFSSLGPRAEWRVRRQNGRNVPYALIVRVNAFENPDNPERATSYLAVARISSRGTCVTERIRPGTNANEQARRAADRASNRPCLEGPPR